MTFNTVGLEHIKVSLLDRNGDVPMISHLNWGQRHGREPNQAYFQLSPDVYRSNYFPTLGTSFSVSTDDGKSLVLTRAQKGVGAALETPDNNSILGEYMRGRLGVPSGALVTKNDLINYGRTDIDFYRDDEGNFYMDFSV